MATKKGLVDRALASKPVTATKDMLDKAVGAVSGAFTDSTGDTPGQAVQNAMPAPRKRAAPKPAATKTTAKTPAKKAAVKKMDRKLVATMEDYEVKYLAQKHGITQKLVKEIVSQVGHSRSKVEAEIKRRQKD